MRKCATVLARSAVRALLLALGIIGLPSRTSGQTRNPLTPWQWTAVTAAIHDPSIAVQYETLTWLRENTRADQVEIPAEVIGATAALLTSEDVRVRKGAIQLLGRKSASGLAPRVAALLRSDGEATQAAALTALGAMQPDAVQFAPQIAAFLESPNPDVRSAAVWSLGQFGKRAAQYVPQVAALLDDRTARGRHSMLSILASLENMGADLAKYAPWLTHALRDTRSATLGIVDWSGGDTPSGILPPLVARLRSHSSYERMRAAEVLEKFGSRGAAYAAEVAALLKSDVDPERTAAMRTLQRFGSGAGYVASQVASLLSDRDLGVRETAMETLGYLGHASAPFAAQVASFLEDADPYVRAHAAESLGRIGPSAAPFATKIEQLLREDDGRARAMYVLALGGVGATRFAPLVAELLESSLSAERQSAAAALGVMPEVAPNIFPKVAALLTDHDPTTRSIALSALASMAREPDLHTLFACLNQSYTHEKEHAAQLLCAYLVGGGDETGQFYIQVLGLRPGISALVDSAQLRPAITWLYDAFEPSRPFPRAHRAVAESITSLARRLPVPLLDTDREQLTKIRGKLVREFASESDALERLLTTPESFTKKLVAWALYAGAAPFVHALAWLVAICFWLPRDPLQFSSESIRTYKGHFYFRFLIMRSSWLRRRMFAPFSTALRPTDPGLAAAKFFAAGEVSEVLHKYSESPRIAIRSVLEAPLGKVVLQGDGGLGKTVHLQRLAHSSARLLVYLDATACNAGVVEAVQAKVHGPLHDKEILQALILGGNLDLLIDGLNEALPETRAAIRKFATESFKANIVMTTQAVDGRSPAEWKVYNLEPLRLDQIVEFLCLQWEPAVRGAEHIERGEFAAKVYSIVRSLDSTLHRRTLAILSNPAYAALAAELLAGGENPNPNRIVDQCFQRAVDEYRAHTHTEFPHVLFAQRVYENVLDDKPFDATGLEEEAEMLVRHRLMRLRAVDLSSVNGANNRCVWSFRHDLVRDHLMAPAFSGAGVHRRMEHATDQRFYGVYEVLASSLPLIELGELHRKLVFLASHTHEHALQERVTHILEARLSTG